MPVRTSVFFVLLAGFGCSRQAGEAKAERRSPVSFVVDKITAGDTYHGSVRVSARNTSAVEIGCYRLAITYRDASGKVLRVREGASKGNDFERMSISGGMTICGPGETCHFDVPGLTPPPGTTSASVEALVLKTINPTRTGCSEEAFFELASSSK
jgi:hypothetical protein